MNTMNKDNLTPVYIFIDKLLKRRMNPSAVIEQLKGRFNVTLVADNEPSISDDDFAGIDDGEDFVNKLYELGYLVVT